MIAPEDGIPVEVRDFILDHIGSIAQLEALLLLRANPGERWDAASISKRLYMSERDVEPLLAQLCADRLLSFAEDTYRYAPEPEERRLVVDRLALVYARQLIPVTNMIHEKQRRIREFADAFRLRRDR